MKTPNRALRAAFVATMAFIVSVIGSKAASIGTPSLSDCKIYHDAKLGITLVTGKLTLPGKGHYWLSSHDAAPLHQIMCQMERPNGSDDANPADRRSTVVSDSDETPPPNEPTYPSVSDRPTSENLSDADTDSKNEEEAPEKSAKTDTKIYTFFALVVTGADERNATSADLEISTLESDKPLKIHWDWAHATNVSGKDGEALLHSWVLQRDWMWSNILTVNADSILAEMLSSSQHVYSESDTESFSKSRSSRYSEDEMETPSLLALTSGRMAVDETLQMRQLVDENIADTDATPGKTVALAAIAGVKVKSHPFEKMLVAAEAAAGSQMQNNPSAPKPAIALADYVPVDRAFFHAAKPAAIRTLLSDSSPSMRRIAALANADMNMDIFNRYAGALGFTPEIAKMLWKNGLAEEYAVFTPDLFFADGTDITLITRTKSADTFDTILKPVLSLLGSAPDKDGICKLSAVMSSAATNAGAAADASADKRFAWWASRGDLIFMSTHEGELRSALALFDAKGSGSLGQSAEFRYMLRKLPPTSATEGYVYLSDPFLRRLVGPAVKIGQFRRMETRLRMESVVAGALVRRLDAPNAHDSLKTLMQLGYVDASTMGKNAAQKNDITFSPENLSVRSATYGPLGQLRPLSAQAASLQNVSLAEAKAYGDYMEKYSNFWRKYFDPIALRLNAGAKTGAHELETFILPLVDNTFYNLAREYLVAGKDTMKTPVFDREPVSMLSARLNKKLWTQITGDWDDDNSNGSVVTSIDKRLFKLLGPSVHLAVVDSAPVMRLGGGNMADSFAISNQLAGREMFFAAPSIALMLTRPCQLMVEVRDPEAARKYLDNAEIYNDTSRRGRRDIDWVRYESVKRSDSEWVCSVTFIGTLSMDFSVRVEGDFIVVTNFPWDAPLRITGSREKAPQGTSSLGLEFWPRAIKAGLSSDFATAMKNERARAVGGMVKLYPWMSVLGLDADEAVATALRTIGAAPVLPAGKITWRDGTLWHERFGSMWNGQLPEYNKANGDFGTFDSVSHASVNMQFEGDGLRTRLSWEMIEAATETTTAKAAQ